MAFDEQQLEQRIDRVITGEMEISHAVGGVALNTFNELFEFSKAMATSKIAVPKHCRGEPGVCMALCVQAFEWRLSPFAVANKSYSVNDRLGYESQLIHAVVEARAPLEKRLRATYSGEGDTRQCTISGTLKGDATPFEYTSPKVKDILVKNSPLWKSDPDQQLFYYASRAWARRYVPDVLLGVYTADELAEVGEGPGSAIDITPPGLGERIAAGKDGKGRGFDAGNIDRALGLENKPGQTIDASAKPEGEKVHADEAPQETKKKRSHHKPKDPANEPRSAGAGAQELSSQATDGGAAGEGAAAAPADPEDAGERVDAGEPVGVQEAEGQPVTQEELDKLDEEFPEETEAQAYARNLVEKIKAHLASAEAPPNIERLREYKTSMRKVIDDLEGLTPDDLDVVRGQFSTAMLEAERAIAKRTKRR